MAAQVLTLPFDLAVEVLTQVINTPSGGWQGRDEKNQWSIGHSTDPDSGVDFFQIIVEPLLVAAKG